MTTLNTEVIQVATHIPCMGLSLPNSKTRELDFEIYKSCQS